MNGFLRISGRIRVDWPAFCHYSNRILHGAGRTFSARINGVFQLVQFLKKVEQPITDTKHHF